MEPGTAGGSGGRHKGSGRVGGGGLDPWVDQPSEGGGAGIRKLGQILTPSAPIWDVHICAGDFSGADPRSFIGVAGAYPSLRGKYPLGDGLQLPPTLCWI